MCFYVDFAENCITKYITIHYTMSTIVQYLTSNIKYNLSDGSKRKSSEDNTTPIIESPFVPNTTYNKEYIGDANVNVSKISWNLENTYKTVTEPLSMNVSKTSWDRQQQYENMFANTILCSSKYALTLNNILNNRLDEIDEELLQLAEYARNTESSKSSNYTDLKGGHMNPELNKNIVGELNYKEPDSQHDFKPSGTRNNVFPSSIKGAKVNTYTSRLVFEKLQSFLMNVNINTVLLQSYIEKSPLVFEEDIKVDYLLGDITGEVEDMSYYFSEANDSPPTWITKRKEFFKYTDANGQLLNPPHSINKLFMDLDMQQFDFWLYDACMSGKIRQQIIPPEFKTLCNLWDPAKNPPIPINELSEKIISDKYPTNSRFEKVTTFGDYDIYNWINPTNKQSYYDLVYDPLLNNDILGTEYNIFIKLRSAVNRVTNICSVAILLFQNEKLGDTIVIKSGFGVNELSRGLRYIETNDTEKLNPLLQQVINTIHSFILKNANINVKNELYKLLIRFKSSGDHGSANTTKLIHTILKKSCIFLSGDNLAYVYSIANETPTLCKYYAGKLASENEHEEDDEDEEAAEADTGQHFIAAYFPCGDNIEKYRMKMNEKISCIGRIFDVAYENPNYSNIPVSEKMEIETMEIEKIVNAFATMTSLTIELDKYIESLKTFVDVFDPDTISKENANKLASLRSQFDFNLLEKIPLNMEYFYLENKTNVDSYERMRMDLRILNNFTNNLYFIQKYTDIVKLTQIIIEEEVTALNEVAGIDIVEIIPSQQIAQQTRRTSRHTGTRINSVYKALVNVFSKQKSSPTSSELLRTAETIGSQSSETKSLKDNLVTVKSKMAGIKNKIKFYLKNKLGFDDSFIGDMNMKIENVKQPYVEKIINKLSTVEVIGASLKKFFYGAYLKDSADTDSEKIASQSIQSSDSDSSVKELKNRPIGNVVGKKERPILSKTKGVVKSLFKKTKGAVTGLFRGGIRKTRKTRPKKSIRKDDKKPKFRKTRKNPL